jgi:hypothetical protein
LSDQAPASGEIRLVVTGGRHRGNVVLLPPKVVLIGRSRQCHLRLASHLVGKRHCALAPHGRTLSVCDLGTHSGTYVNGRRVDGQARVRHGDELRVGPVHFRVCVPRTLCWKEPLDPQRREIAWLWDAADDALWDHLDRLGDTPPRAERFAGRDGNGSCADNGDHVAIAAGRLWTSAMGNGHNGSA